VECVIITLSIREVSAKGFSVLLNYEADRTLLPSITNWTTDSIRVFYYCI